MHKNSILTIATAIFLCGSCSSDPIVEGTNETPIVTQPTQYTDTQLIEMVQKDALKYFWDYAESNSKLARER